MNSLYKYILSLLPVLLLGLMSCEDTLLYDSVDIPEGESIVTATIDFHQFDKTNLGSRAAGDSYDYIRNLWILVYNSDGTELLKSHEVKITKPVTEKTETSIPLDFGRYQIYAVANIDGFDPTGAPTVDALKSLRLEWKQPDEDGNIGKNDEMLGVFAKDNTESDGSNTIIVNRKTVNISAQLIRAASKVTVAYDGSALEDGVSVYIRSLSIKRIPMGCYLGNQSMVTKADSLIGDGGTIVYYDGTSYDSNTPTLINKENPFYPRKDAVAEDQPAYSDSKDPHAHTSTNSLFFYENLQGLHDDIDKCKYIDEDGDGRLDWVFPHQLLPYTTYIEVDARWESTNPKSPGVTDIKYRFMLGQDIQYDYNTKRNHHYKLTLHLHGYAADPDWRIAYERMFSVTPGHHVDYRGKYLEPNDWANHGHNFISEKVIEVNSYFFPEDNPGDEEVRGSVPFSYEFQNENGEKIQKPEWLIFEQISPQGDEEKRGVTKYNIGFAENKPKTVEINQVLNENTSTRSDLSFSSEGMTTANCYIVDAKGTYTFPLVYGNAIEKGADNKSSYTNFTAGVDVLDTMKNYLDRPISSPYIVDDIKKYKGAEFNYENLEAWVIWTDVKTLISLHEYDETLYGNKGGIKFKIDNPEEGNVVIGIKNKADGEIMWSWHIWVTGIDQTFTSILTSRENGKVIGKYEIMPVNLGWCSNGEPVTYYSRRACKIKFTQDAADGQEAYTHTIDIVQHPFVGVPMGNCTFYQWGRKDPFIGSDKNYTNKNWDGIPLNKIWYRDRIMDWGSGPVKSIEWDAGPHHLLGNGNFYLPYNYLNEDSEGGDPGIRPYTKDILAELIKNPQKFNNPRRKGYRKPLTNGADDKGYGGDLEDDIYSNLWLDDRKTVYDPCPVGYRVSPYDTFRGFTFNGQDLATNEDNSKLPASALPVDEKAWFNVSPENMHKGYEYTKGVSGFYTDESKVEPVSFTNNGYLDYAAVNVIFAKNHGYIWLAKNENKHNSYFLKHCRNIEKDSVYLETEHIPLGSVGPVTRFYATDGMPVRPTRVIQVTH